MALGQRIAKSGGRPSAKRSRRGVAVTDVSRPGLQAGGATTSSSELKSLTQKFCDRKAQNGPATRPKTPLAVENSVGKLAASARLMPARERERGALPSPFRPRPAARPGGDFCFHLQHNIGRMPVVSRDNPRKVLGYLGRTAVMSARLRRFEEEHIRERG